MESKKYAAFLSFADHDRELVKALQNLLSLLDLQVFFAPEDLPKAGTPEWQVEIHKAIKNSNCFLPIFTRNSIIRPWVLYESGAADSLGLPKYSARIEGVSIEDMRKIPGGDVFVYNLHDPQSVIELVLNVFEKTRGKDEKQHNEKAFRRLLKNSQEIISLNTLAQSRWVFIAGSCPSGKEFKPDLKIDGKPDLNGEAILSNVVSDVT